MQEYCIKTSSNTCFGYLLETEAILYLLETEAILTNIKNICSVRNKNKARSFLHIIMSIKDSLQQQIHLMATSLVTNADIVTRVHCISTCT